MRTHQEGSVQCSVPELRVGGRNWGWYREKLEQVPCEVRWKELGLLHLAGRKLKGNLTVDCNCLKGGYKGNCIKLLVLGDSIASAKSHS